MSPPFLTTGHWLPRHLFFPQSGSCPLYDSCPPANCRDQAESFMEGARVRRRFAQHSPPQTAVSNKKISEGTILTGSLRARGIQSCFQRMKRHPDPNTPMLTSEPGLTRGTDIWKGQPASPLLPVRNSPDLLLTWGRVEKTGFEAARCRSGGSCNTVCEPDLPMRHSPVRHPQGRGCTALLGRISSFPHTRTLESGHRENKASVNWTYLAMEVD